MADRTLALIVAMSENRVIARGGKMPWRLPDDLRHFVKKTSGHHVIMGRKTFETLDAPLRDRTNIVITRQRYFSPQGALVFHDVDHAIDHVLENDDPQPFVIGGGEIYRQALPRVTRMYITLIHAQLEGDTFFPEIDENQWRLVSEEHRSADERHTHPFSFLLYEKR